MHVIVITAPEETDPNRIGTDEDSLRCRKARERGKPHRPPAHLSVWAGKLQGDLLGEGVWDCGKSERPAVMVGTGVPNLPYRESGQTSTWCNRRRRLYEF